MRLFKIVLGIMLSFFVMSQILAFAENKNESEKYDKTEQNETIDITEIEQTRYEEMDTNGLQQPSEDNFIDPFTIQDPPYNRRNEY